MLYVGLHVLWENDNIIEIYQAGLPAVPIKDDIQGTLEIGPGVHQREGHTLEPVSTYATCERGLLTVFFLHGDPQISTVGIESGEDIGFSPRLNSIIHEG